MSKNYSPSVATALKLIAKFGAAVTLTTQTTGAYDIPTGAATVTTSTQSGYGVRTEWTKQDESWTLVQVNDVKLVLAASGITTAPKVNDTVLFDGISYTVISVKPAQPATVAIVYTLNLRA